MTTRYSCGPNLVSNNKLSVLIVNDTELAELLKMEHRSGTPCIIVCFYAPYCPFSARLAPFYNSLPRAFPDLIVAAIDASKFDKFNPRFGISGVPTLLLFYGSKAVARFNGSDYGLMSLNNFIGRHTDLEFMNGTDVEDFDYDGPLPSKTVKKTDYYLLLSWMFLIIFTVYCIVQLNAVKAVYLHFRSMWTEANEL